jgi:hypothetical protein
LARTNRRITANPLLFMERSSSPPEMRCALRLCIETPWIVARSSPPVNAGSAAFCPVTAVYACFANAILMPM